MASSSSSSSNTTSPPTNSLPLIDVDCNLLHDDLRSLSSDPSSILSILSHESTLKSNIVALLSPSSTINESCQMIDLLSSQSNNNNTASAPSQIEIKTTAGIHPYHATTNVNDDLSQLQTILSKSSEMISCVGECGLDYSEGFPPADIQRPTFDGQLDLAFQFNKPLFIHERLAFDDLLRAIDAARDRCGGGTTTSVEIPKIIIHCFTGTVHHCREYIKRGYYISLSGYVNRNGDGPDQIRQCLRDGIIPLDRLMIETDAPYMGFDGCRDSFLECEPNDKFAALNAKKRKRLSKAIYPNVPSSLGLVFRGVREVINEGRLGRDECAVGEMELARIFANNAVEFFGFKNLVEDDMAKV